MYTLIINNGELQCHIKSFTEGLELKDLPDNSGKKETTAALYITTYISAENGEGVNTFDNISLVDFLPYLKDGEKIVFESTKYTSISNAKGDYDQTAETPEYYIDISFQTNPRL